MSSTSGLNSGNVDPSVISGPQNVSNTAEVVFDQIRGVGESIAGLAQDLQALLAEVQNHLQNKPQYPGSDAKKEAKAKYQQDLQAWQAQLTQLQGKVSQLETKIDQQQDKLRNLESQALPAAQRADAESMSRALAESKKNLEAVRDGLKAQAGDLGADDIAASARRKEITGARTPPPGAGLPGAGVP